MKTARIELTVHPDGKFTFESDTESGYRCEWGATLTMFANVMTRMREGLTPADQTDIDRLDRRISKLEDELRRIRLFWSHKAKKPRQ